MKCLKLSAICGMVLLHGIHGFAQSKLLLPVKYNNLWGYCDTAGTVEIPLQYDFAGLFNRDDVATVKKAGISYIINKKGEVISEGACKEIKPVDTDIYACYNGSDWKLYGKRTSGTFPYSIKALEESQGFWVFYTSEGAGLMNGSGEMLLKPEFDQILPSGVPGYFLLYKDSLMGVSDPGGQMIVPVAYYFTDYREPGIIVFNSHDKMGVVSVNGKISTDTLYNDIRSNKNSPFIILFDERRTTVFHTSTGKQLVLDSLTGVDFYDSDFLQTFTREGLNLLDSNLTEVFPTRYESIRRDNGGYIVRKNNLFGYCNAKGREVHTPKYTFITGFVGNTSITGSGALRGIIHASGEVIAEPLYRKAEIYSETAKMYTDSSVHTIDFDKNGKIIGQSNYRNFKTISIGGFKDMRKPSQTSESPVPPVWFFDIFTQKWGLNDASGQQLIPPTYDFVNRWTDKLSKVGIRKEGAATIDNVTLHYKALWGIVNHQTGQVIIPAGYIDIRPDSALPSKPEAMILTDAGLKFYIKDHESAKLSGPFTWVGKSTGYVRPVAVGGKLTLVAEDTSKTSMGKLGQYVNGHYTSGTFTVNSYRNKLDRDVVLTNAGYYLFRVNEQVSQKQRFQYISDFKRNYAVMKVGHRFGVIDENGTQIVPPVYHKIEIIHHGHSVFFFKYNERETYGFIKSDGQWAFEQKLPSKGTFSDGMAFVGRNNSLPEEALVCLDTSGHIAKLPWVTKHGYFTEGLVPIKQRRTWGYYDKNFNVSIEDKTWSWAGQFSQGLAPVRTRNEYFYIDNNGNRVFEGTFSKAEPFNEFGALVQRKGKWGLIDTKGEYIIKPKYKQAKFKVPDSLYYFAKNGGWLIYRPDGTLLTKALISHNKPFVEGQTLVYLSSGKTAILQKDGDLTYAPKDHRIQSVQGEFVIAFIPGVGIRMVDPNFTELTDKRHTSFRYGREGVIFCRLRSTGWVALDPNGKFLFKVNGIPISGFVEGHAVIRLPDGSKMYINKKGEQEFGMFFTYAEPFRNGRAKIATAKGYGIIDNDGTFIVTPKYKYIGPFNEGYANVQMQSSISISNQYNRPLVDGLYDAVTLEPFGYFRVESADRVGWISRDGKIVWNPAR